MSDKLPPLLYYKWFWQNWRANRKVQRMTYIGRGLYRELLDECWVEGSIPDDIALLAEICACPIDAMEAHWWEIKPCFFVGKSGQLENKMLNDQRTYKDAIRVQNIQNGSKGGTQRALNNNELESCSSERQADAKQTLTKRHIVEKSRVEKSIMSGKPDALELLGYLNKKTNRDYKPVKANLSMIEARLKEFSKDDLIAVIDRKVKVWCQDEKMAPYLRPATLFGAKNCAQYVGEIPKGPINTALQKVELVWFLDDKQVDEYGRKAGIAYDVMAGFSVYRTLVFDHYGVTPEQYKKAFNDWRGIK